MSRYLCVLIFGSVLIKAGQSFAQKATKKTKSILLAATQVFNFKPEPDNDESSLTNLAVGKCSLQNKLDITTKRLPKLAEDK